MCTSIFLHATTMGVKWSGLLQCKQMWSREKSHFDGTCWSFGALIRLVSYSTSSSSL
uniref:Uncharacterized protein n=1 Tax=Physcomitrium patens TaxID=3218 RepID=A0A2K1IMF7_PHYPA|nr:hypothetical protein PHYPA_026781 [Physcomitrium patens]